MTGAKKKQSVSQLIAVDAGKLSQGLKTTFEGMAMVFDAIGTDVTLNDIPGKAETVTKAKAKEADDGNGDTKEPKDDAGTMDDHADGSGAVSDDTAEVAQEKEAIQEAVESEDEAQVEGETQEKDAAQDEPEQAAETSITLDDVTKIIVQKIKQNRSNNDKIGQILKTYGVAKVGELDQSKYEAFLTDLAAL